MHQKELTIKNVYAFKKRISRHVKQITELKEKIDISTMIIENFNSLFSIIDRITRLKNED